MESVQIVVTLYRRTIRYPAAWQGKQMSTKDPDVGLQLLILFYLDYQRDIFGVRGCDEGFCTPRMSRHVKQGAFS
jgi:hypothetical protein